MPRTVEAQEFIIYGYPPNVGYSIDPSFYEKFHDTFKQVADALRADSTLVAFVWGEADSLKYPNSHDTHNAGIAVSRAHSVRDVLVYNFECDSTRVFVQSMESRKKGGKYRSVTIVLQKVAFGPENPKRDTVIHEIIRERINNIYDSTYILVDNFGFTIGAGVSSARYRTLPEAFIGIDWKRQLQLEFQGGIGVTTSDYAWEGETLTNRNVLYSMALTAYPWKTVGLGLTAGIQGEEDIAQQKSFYTRRCRQFLLGARMDVYKNIDIGVYWTPGYERNEGKENAVWVNNQFRVNLIFAKRFGFGGNYR